tara:strand:- start:256 stop:522 length:267 start_codon:yes stop_codon:yes gene_type:complete
VVAIVFLRRREAPHLFSQHPDQGAQCGVSISNQLVKRNHHRRHHRLGRQGVVQVMLKILEQKQKLLTGRLLHRNIRGERQQMFHEYFT